MTLCVPIMTGVGNGGRGGVASADAGGRRLTPVPGLPPPPRNAWDQIS